MPDTTTQDSSTISPSAPLLNLKGVQKTYRMGGRDLTVLRGVDIVVKKGQCVAILGSSGSGKSTLLHLMGGLDRPDQGTIEFQGKPLQLADRAAVDRFRRQHVGFVFQQYHLLPELNVVENVMLAPMIDKGITRWRGIRKVMHERALALLDRLGLSERLTHRPAKLSGGERQRVAIARALMNEPDLLLADEPTGNLDRETGEQILHVFRDLHARGQTLILVTHDPHVAQAADRQLYLTDGRLGAKPHT